MVLLNATYTTSPLLLLVLWVGLPKQNDFWDETGNGFGVYMSQFCRSGTRQQDEKQNVVGRCQMFCTPSRDSNITSLTENPTGMALGLQLPPTQWAQVFKRSIIAL